LAIPREQRCINIHGDETGQDGDDYDSRDAYEGLLMEDSDEVTDEYIERVRAEYREEWWQYLNEWEDWEECE
jgi:hypothetical protein